MKQKKILLLGGGFFQVPSVIAAKRLGYYTVTCDYLPDNPGHQYADEYHNVSTVEKEAVLELARRLRVDGILCYASDASARTAAYVAEKMGLPGNPYRSVEILSVKEKFREFLRNNGFNTPEACGYGDFETAYRDLDRFRFPIMVKPTDGWGSKGVSKVEEPGRFAEAFQFAREYSRAGRVIVEEFVPNNGKQIIGDGISHNGVLAFRAFGDHLFNKKEGKGSPFVPAGGIWPSFQSPEVHQRIHDEIQRLIKLLNMGNCAYNFEVRLTEEKEPVLIEVGARNGGNMIPQVLKYATGVDMVDFVVRTAVGEDVEPITQKEPDGFWAYYVVHSNQSGVLNRIDIDPNFQQKYLRDFWRIKNKGDKIEAFSGSFGTLGTMALRFDSYDEGEEILNSAEKYVRVVLE